MVSFRIGSFTGLIFLLLGTCGAVEPNSIATLSQSQAAHKLVAEHLPELKVVLTSLKKNAEKEYQKAIIDLAKASRRVEQYREQDSTAFDLEIKLLQAQTRADLALAQLQLNDSEKARNKYRSALKTREMAKLARLRHEKTRLSDRISKMEKQLERMSNTIENSSIQDNVERTFTFVIRRLDQKREPNARQKRKSDSPSSKGKIEK